MSDKYCQLSKELGEIVTLAEVIAEIDRESAAQDIFALADRVRAERQWQPIETAPRDGREVQLWCDGWTSGWYGRSAERWYNVLGFEVEPTHWMPLPAGPEVEDG